MNVKDDGGDDGLEAEADARRMVTGVVGRMSGRRELWVNRTIGWSSRGWTDDDRVDRGRVRVTMMLREGVGARMSVRRVKVAGEEEEKDGQRDMWYVRLMGLCVKWDTGQRGGKEKWLMATATDDRTDRSKGKRSLRPLPDSSAPCHAIAERLHSITRTQPAHRGSEPPATAHI